jgi:3-deoxy-D-manno-octulosonate 8-phosphate phosphatase (KDO 8-P phosphatase)
MIEKAKNVKLLILDVDGVLTSGAIYYGNDNIEMRSFHIHDGLGIKLLQQTGVKVGIISGKKSDLNIQYAYLGNDDKLPAYEELKQKLHLQDQDIAYMGDDLPDLPLLRRTGFSITVPNAPAIIKQYADYITQSKAGYGAVREVCELIMQAQGQYQTVIDKYDLPI